MPIGYRSACIAACLLLASLAPGRADPAPVIHYAPAENLEHIDVASIDRAEHEIDMAAYVLTNWSIMQALTRAADRAVKVRIYLDAPRWDFSPGPIAIGANPNNKNRVDNRACGPYPGD
jgi:phosphatidylserine/phosphatidylglycerophosphate/cardiolipin synthase-like enzyme